MAKKIVPLTDFKVKSARAGDKPVTLFDGDGLFLHVAVTGTKTWRLKYRHAGAERLITLGRYPAMGLAAARAAALAQRKLLAENRDPMDVRRSRKSGEGSDTFGALALEWFQRTKNSWKESHARTVLSRLERDILPWLGRKAVTEITPPDVLAALRRVEGRGALETAARERQIIGQVFEYAASCGHPCGNPAHVLRKALQPPPERHYPAIVDEAGVGELLRAAWAYRGGLVVRCALKLSFYFMLRPGEVRQLEWAWVDFSRSLVSIPAGTVMKGYKGREKAHVVPLSRQALELLEELRLLTGAGRFLFPNARNTKEPMTNNAVRQAIRNMGYTKEETCAHSLRTTASTLLNESGRWSRDAVELSLAHEDENKVRAIYNRSQLLDERRRMMQWYADKLDELRLNATSNIVTLAAR